MAAVKTALERSKADSAAPVQAGQASASVSSTTATPTLPTTTPASPTSPPTRVPPAPSSLPLPAASTNPTNSSPSSPSGSVPPSPFSGEELSRPGTTAFQPSPSNAPRYEQPAPRFSGAAFSREELLRPVATPFQPPPSTAPNYDQQPPRFSRAGECPPAAGSQAAPREPYSSQASPFPSSSSAPRYEQPSSSLSQRAPSTPNYQSAPQPPLRPEQPSPSQKSPPPPLYFSRKADLTVDSPQPTIPPPSVQLGASLPPSNTPLSSPPNAPSSPSSTAPPPQSPPPPPNSSSFPPPNSSSPPSPPTPSSPPPPQEEPAYLRFYPRHLRQLARSLPSVHLRPPSIDDILKVATGFWQRLSIRFRWLTIRSFRRFTAEEYTTFLGWFVLSQTVWLLVGTTTFVGAIVFTLNSLRLQHYVARVISDYLTAETGWEIAYESATVPRWRDATLSFKNVYVSQKPTTYTVTNEDGTTEERASYMTVNLDIDSIDVTLSLWRWLDGKGLVKNAVVKGVRGVMDRRDVYWDPDRIYNPADFRHKGSPGAFELESLRIEDALITVYQTKRFRPFFVSIYKAEIGRFRRQWMCYDFISAESIVGQFDNCLFSVHKPQSVSRTRDAAMKDEGWKRLSRLRIDGVNIDHLKATLSSDVGLWSWIQSGKLDAVLDIRFPSHPDDDLDLQQIISNITAELAEQLDRIPGQRELARPALEVPGDLEIEEAAIAQDLAGDTKPRKVEIDIDLRFRDLKASVPLWTNELSYMNNALIRPIVAFINANRTLLPIRCHIVKDLSEFDGSWTLWETGLMDDIAIKTYEALAYHVQHGMNRNIRAVSLWSLQMTGNAVLAALRNALDHAGEGMLSLQNLQMLTL
ncbi:hypothetical protein DACRYDRAFT_20942 [Dacryopinax primogenitus]|uniref:Mitochondrial distribution and morphology protein family 31/32 n=1 Tax=Dacryopinax primogenitus (strain DJM 731) TaxID=1858805 RepID=M5G2G0_DACPD|nr:uncharacterized protein DACRYDRAFT_20942 [Dacryopinax primogenitus]EJU04401.1 hypothetical protein DACRYDRAFT_20942 [Dacryopinax primogenitus]